MKKLTKVFVFFVLFNQNTIAQTGWFIQPSFTSQNLYDCKASAYNILYMGSDNGTIFKSSNGGFNWTVYNFNDPLLTGSPLKIVIGQSNDNWTTAGGGNAFGYKHETIDSVMRISVSPQITLEALSVVSGYFFYSSTVVAGTGGHFYIKDGVNWRKDTAATRIAAGRNINYSSGHIFVGDDGLIMKADSVGLTHSNGERIKWRVIPSGTTKNLYSVMTNSGATYMAVGEDGIILKTTNFGETWNIVPSPVTEDLYSVWLGYGYLIGGANGTILRSYDLNLNKWYKQITPTTEDLYQVMTLGYSEYVSMGRNGIFLRTNDGGGSRKRFIGTSIIEGFYNPSTNLLVPDTISVTVRSSTSPFNIIATSKEQFSNGGYGMIELGPTVQNSVPYYIQINHRNSIETWSKTTQVFTNNDLYYDFYPAANKAYGNNQKQVDASPVRFAFYSGDFNQDGYVNLTDVIGVYNAASIFTNGYAPSDMNGDNITDLTDVIITNNNSNLFVSVVKP